MALENSKKKNTISTRSILEFQLYLGVGVRSDVFYSCTGLKKKCFFRFPTETPEVLKPIYLSKKIDTQASPVQFKTHSPAIGNHFSLTQTYTC